MKKRGFGEGKYNGAGGKVEKRESFVEGARRELGEETGIHIEEERFEKKGLFHFSFVTNPDWNQDVTLFLVHDYDGEIFETEEMRPEWFDIGNIPYNKMWSSDIVWFPRVLAGEDVEYDFNFDENGEILSFSVIK